VGAVTTARRVLGLHRTKWERVGPSTLASAAASVITAAMLIALNRFGALITVEPRAPARLTLVVVWGWLGMAAVAAVVLAARASPRPQRRSLRSVVAVVGSAHVPLIWLAAVLILAAGALQLLWPGLLTALFVFGFWFPASVFTGIRISCGASLWRTVVATTVSYAAWLALVGRHLYDQLAHLV